MMLEGNNVNQEIDENDLQQHQAGKKREKTTSEKNLHDPLKCMGRVFSKPEETQYSTESLKKLLDQLIEYKNNDKENFQQVKIFSEKPSSHEIENSMLGVYTKGKKIIDIFFFWRRHDYSPAKKMMTSSKLPDCIPLVSCLITDPAVITEITQLAHIANNEQLAQLLRLRQDVEMITKIEKENLIQFLKQIAIISLQSPPQNTLTFFSSLVHREKSPVSFATQFGRHLRTLLQQEHYSELKQVICDKLNIMSTQHVTYGNLREFARGKNDQSLFAYCDGEMRVLLDKVVQPKTYTEIYGDIIKTPDDFNKIFNHKAHRSHR